MDDETKDPKALLIDSGSLHRRRGNCRATRRSSHPATSKEIRSCRRLIAFQRACLGRIRGSP
jgi:hypothetical protein